MKRIFKAASQFAISFTQGLLGKTPTATMRSPEKYRIIDGPSINEIEEHSRDETLVFTLSGNYQLRVFRPEVLTFSHQSGWARIIGETKSGQIVEIHYCPNPESGMHSTAKF